LIFSWVAAVCLDYSDTRIKQQGISRGQFSRFDKTCTRFTPLDSVSHHMSESRGASSRYRKPLLRLQEGGLVVVIIFMGAGV
jgi:hypothetical protein